MGKSLKNTINPALQFISVPVEEPEKQEPRKVTIQTEEVEQDLKSVKIKQKAPEGYKLDPRYVETKSRRLQLLIQPSLHDALKARAAAEGVSVNELVNSILQDRMKGGR